MIKRSSREIIFFVMLFLLFFLIVKLSVYLTNKYSFNESASFLVSGIVYSLIVTALFFMANLNCDSGENFWDISAGALCKGGPYNWQGDDPVSKMCREMAQTEKGRCEISSYSCPSGYIGTPRLPFQYTPLSNDKWHNEQCDDSETCKCRDTGLCSMVKQT